jgi:hypothetical protein
VEGSAEGDGGDGAEGRESRLSVGGTPPGLPAYKLLLLNDIHVPSFAKFV